MLAAGRVIAAALNGAATYEELFASIKKAPRRQKALDYVNTNAADFATRSAFHATLCKKAFDLNDGESAIILNGKIVKNAAGNIPSYHDFLQFEKSESKSIAGNISPLMHHVPGHSALPAPAQSDQTMKLAAFLTSNVRSSKLLEEARRVNDDNLSFFGLKSHVIKFQSVSQADAPRHKITAFVNPLSHEAQALAPILHFLTQAVSVDMIIVLNPQQKLSELPLKRFFRYLAVPKLKFTPEGAISGPPTIVFQNLPAAPLLTLTLHTPPSWMALPVKSAYDLDNIHLESAPSGVHAEFELQHIVVEGSCVNSYSRRPAAGVQLQLGREANAPMFDTIVMSNLGYFQLKSTPGAWKLQLRPGRSTTVFNLSGEHSGVDSHSNADSPAVVVNSFSGKYMRLYVQPRPGQENVRLLDIVENESSSPQLVKREGQGMWGMFRGMFGSESATASPSKVESAVISSGRSGETINIFSLASGHLYERFMKIMMLSVLKHTNHPVKFWFLENCMSPRFKEFLPKFAAEKGFEFELVQYNWPSWLNKQTEKHRLIWAYKILFLDVLFPQDVKKIIFVDADQVVRADLYELVQLDLEGAPYGYTPFCDNRPDMDGFRFWKSGYWHNHMGGRKYHISALYVIDLVRFRQLAAGDQLREQYQGLSQDPNSLANLDQDLPNYMIHQVR